jgi:hypothetical protein
VSRRPVDDNSPLARLAAVLHPTDSHPDRILAASDADALELVRLAREHRISALLSRTLETAGRLDALAEPVRSALRQDVLDSVRARAEQEMNLLNAAGALGEARVPFLVLKGAALGALIYPAPHLRTMTDVDLLVRPGDLDAALDALGRAGFEKPSSEAHAFWREAYYNLPVRSPSGGLVELHWSIAQATRQRPDIQGLFDRARDIRLDGRRMSALGAADLLLHQSLHHSYHYFEPRIIWIYDLALLHQASPPAVEVVARAREWGMGTILALSVMQVERTFPGAADPPLRDFAERSRKAQVLRVLFGSRDPVALLGAWNHRGKQLLLAAAMIDRPGAVLGAGLSWSRRVLRHGDRAGRGRHDPGGMS